MTGTEQGLAMAIAVEKDRLESARHAYEAERGRRELIERQAQYHLALLAVVVGAASFRADSLLAFRQHLATLWHTAPAAATLIVIASGVAVMCVCSALVSIAALFFPRRGLMPYPPEPMTAFFDTGDREGEPLEGLARDPHTRFLVERATDYLLAVENARVRNDALAKWLAGAAIAVIAFIFALTTIVVTIAIGS